MERDPEPDGWGHRLRLAGAVFLVAGGLMAALATAWARDLRSPRVTVLGAGRQLSVLVTAGEARLLLATGDDPGAFANALARARHPTTRRLDVLLVAGAGDALLAPLRALDDDRVRYAASIGPLTPSAETTALATHGLPVLATPRRIRLGAEVSVTVEQAEAPPDGENGDGSVAWRAVVRRGATTVVVLSDGGAAAAFAPVGPVAALIVVGDDPLAGWEAMPAPALALPAGAPGSVSGKELRQAALVDPGAERWAIRVHPGEAVRLDFVAGGLEIPREPSQRLPATPGTGFGVARLRRRPLRAMSGQDPSHSSASLQPIGQRSAT